MHAASILFHKSPFSPIMILIAMLSDGELQVSMSSGEGSREVREQAVARWAANKQAMPTALDGLGNRRLRCGACLVS